MKILLLLLLPFLGAAQDSLALEDCLIEIYELRGDLEVEQEKVAKLEAELARDNAYEKLGRGIIVFVFRTIINSVVCSK